MEEHNVAVSDGCKINVLVVTTKIKMLEYIVDVSPVPPKITLSGPQTDQQTANKATTCFTGLCMCCVLLPSMTSVVLVPIAKNKRVSIYMGNSVDDLAKHILRSTSCKKLYIGEMIFRFKGKYVKSVTEQDAHIQQNQISTSWLRHIFWPCKGVKKEISSWSCIMMVCT